MWEILRMDEKMSIKKHNLNDQKLPNKIGSMSKRCTMTYEWLTSALELLNVGTTTLLKIFIQK